MDEGKRDDFAVIAGKAIRSGPERIDLVVRRLKTSLVSIKGEKKKIHNNNNYNYYQY